MQNQDSAESSLTSPLAWCILLVQCLCHAPQVPDRPLQPQRVQCDVVYLCERPCVLCCPSPSRRVFAAGVITIPSPWPSPQPLNFWKALSPGLAC
jgi:hypothetical protein